jgi:hypothetical protein
MIEEEAKTKWCPMAKTIVEAGTGGFNRPFSPEAGYPATEMCHCIASECMAWRWEPAKPFELEVVELPMDEYPETYQEYEQRYKDDSDYRGPRWFMERTVTSAVTRWRLIERRYIHGFCGLSGRTE